MREILLEKLKLGIGTLAPTRSLGLDVVPLVRERYDLLTTEEEFYHRPTQALFERVKSDHLTVNCVGYGAMQFAGAGVCGSPKVPDAAVAVLKEAVTLGVREAGDLPSTRQAVLATAVSCARPLPA